MRGGVRSLIGGLKHGPYAVAVSGTLLADHGAWRNWAVLQLPEDIPISGLERSPSRAWQAQ